jgi:hypothetical protein
MSASIPKNNNVERLTIPPNETAAETITDTLTSQAAHSAKAISVA